MPDALPAALRSRILRLLLLQWRPDAITTEVHCGVRTVYRLQENLFIYRPPFPPHRRQKKRPQLMCKAAEDSLLGKLYSYSYIIY